MIDFEGINQAAVRDYRSILRSLIPGGKFRGQEYVVKNPCRNDQHAGSFSISIKGVWKDFATGEGGSDFISLCAWVRGIRQGEAARELAEKLGLPLHKPNRATTLTNGASGGYNAAAPLPEPKIVSGSENLPPPQSDELRRHIYPGCDGIAVKVKIKLRDGSYTQRYRVEDGWQARKPDDFQSVPYVTEAINPFDPELKDDQIFWTEGEKDVDTLNRLNLPAFTFGGVGDGLPSGIEQYVKDRHLVILADNDQAGRDHAEKKAALAHSIGAASIKIVHFPELPEKDDVSDFIDGGGTAEQLVDRASVAPLWEPPPHPEMDSATSGGTASDWRSKTIKASDLQSMTFAPARYVLPGYVSEGVSILAGKPKIGKSWLTFDLAIAVAAGRFTLGTLKPAQGDVLYLALEDSNRRLKRRMMKLLPGSEARWTDRLTLTTEWRRADVGGVADIESWCKSVSQPVLIVIDTLEKFRPIQNGRTPAYAADYQAITGLQKLAGELGIAVVINHHVRKMEADDPFDTVSGTLGLTGAADTILVLKRQSGAVTLHARGRDIEESETALQFDRSTCRWTILGEAADVHMSHQRAAVLAALAGAGADGLAVSEIMAATGNSNRNAMDILLFKMKVADEVVRFKRGVYAIGKDDGKIGKKERNGGQDAEKIDINSDLSDLSGDEVATAFGKDRRAAPRQATVDAPGPASEWIDL